MNVGVLNCIFGPELELNGVLALAGGSLISMKGVVLGGHRLLFEIRVEVDVMMLFVVIAVVVVRLFRKLEGDDEHEGDRTRAAMGLKLRWK